MRSGVRVPTLAAAACAAAVLVVLVLAYSAGPFSTLDVKALSGLEALQGPVAWPVLSWVAHTADPMPFALIVVTVVAAGFALGRRRQALTALAAVVGANVATEVLKVVLAHPRFQAGVAGDHIDAAAFPSGHATAAMSVALAAVIVSPPRLRARVAPVAALYALAVATSVLVLGWHFPSDVFGGFLVASAFAFVCVAASRALAGREAPVTSPRVLAAARPSAGMALALAAVAAAVVLARFDDLLQFARAHTAGAIVLACVTAMCAALLASATLLADG